MLYYVINENKIRIFGMKMSFNISPPEVKQEMSQSRDECPQRNLSSTRQIRGKLAVI